MKRPTPTPPKADRPSNRPSGGPGKGDRPSSAGKGDRPSAPGKAPRPSGPSGRLSSHDHGHGPNHGPGRGPDRHPGSAGKPHHPGGAHGFRPAPHPPHHPSHHRPPHHHPHHVHHPHHYAPFYYYHQPYHAGWVPYYRPVYPWWIDVAEFGAGYALGWYMANGQRIYYYYPSDYAVDDGLVYYEDAAPVPAIAEPAPVILGGEAEPEPVTEALEEEEIPDMESILEDVPEDQELPQVTKAEIDDAWKNIQEGDSAFASGDLALAADRYSKVSEDLPALPDSWYRLAFTEMARGNYEKASDYSMSGMEASRIWPASPFSLEYIYQGKADRKEKDLKALEIKTDNSPSDASLNLLAGLTFYSDGQSGKAAKYLKKAENISPDLKEFVEPILKNIE